MQKKKYKLRYLPLFYEDMEATVNYITESLNNPKVMEVRRFLYYGRRDLETLL